jgi:uncharacterized membrane protein (UPF0127 family)
MNKRTLPVLILSLIVIVCVAILVQNLAAPSSVPSGNAPTSELQTQPSSIQSVSGPIGDQNLKVVSLKAPNGTLQIEVASTSLQQAKGLGNRPSLPADRGMLFPFMYPGDYGFWMKDMHFPIDMVWISSDKKVVSVTPNVSPDSYPTVFYPPGAISYVLELNAGAAKEFGIATGTQLVF